MKRVMAIGVLLASPAAWADQVVLRGGGVIHGEIVEQTAAGLVIEVGPGRMTLPMSRVERVVASTSDLSLYRARASRLAAGDAAGWVALARWAESRDLLTQARDAYERALAADPGNAAANAALGRVRMAGGWVSAEDSYRARGMVAFEGTWMTPAERAAILSDRAAEARGRELAAEAEARAREAEARARVAEAEARRAEADAEAGGEGIPYPFVFGGGVYGGPVYGGPVYGGPHGARGHRHRGHRSDDRPQVIIVTPPPPRDRSTPPRKPAPVSKAGLSPEH